MTVDNTRVTTQGRLRSKKDWKFFVIAAGIVLIASGLRFYHLGTQELWMDEAKSFHMATAAEWPDEFMPENNVPAYYLLLRGWVTWFGSSEAALRSLSAVFGVLFVVVVIWAGCLIFTPQVGLWAGSFAAVAPIHIYYSQEARTYTLLTFALLLTYVTLWRALQRNTRVSWILVVPCALVALYSHYSAILGLIPSVLVVLTWPAHPARERWTGYGLAVALTALFFFPWPLSSSAARTDPFGWSTAWISYVWEKTPPILAIPKTLEVFGVGPQDGLPPISLKQFYELPYPAFLRFLQLGVLVGLSLWVLGAWREQSLAISWLRRKKSWLGVMLFLPLLLLWAFSFYKPMYVVGRYDMIAFPAFALLVGLAMTKLQRGLQAGQVIAPVVALALFLPLGVKLFLYYEAPAERPWEQIAKTVDKMVDNGDVLLLNEFIGGPLIYQLSRLGYRWKNGYCEKEMGRRRFSCVKFLYFVSRAAIRDFLRNSYDQGHGFWLAYGHFEGTAGHMMVPKWEHLLIVEAKRLGFTPTRMAGAPGLLRLSREQ
jgi:4-amino-4-deoxy-L-arabinose transferase-like glycosyltransferase